jgi:surface protein
MKFRSPEELRNTILNLNEKEKIVQWDVSLITNMESLFFNIPNKTILLCNIGEWNVSNVTNMSGMFEHCSDFNVDINEWDVSNVINMENMFSGCHTFNQPLEKWNVDKVCSMDQMFSRCTSFRFSLASWNNTRASVFNMFFDADDTEDFLKKHNYLPRQLQFEDKILTPKQFPKLNDSLEPNLFCTFNTDSFDKDDLPEIENSLFNYSFNLNYTKKLLKILESKHLCTPFINFYLKQRIYEMVKIHKLFYIFGYCTINGKNLIYGCCICEIINKSIHIRFTCSTFNSFPRMNINENIISIFAHYKEVTESNEKEIPSYELKEIIEYLLENNPNNDGIYNYTLKGNPLDLLLCMYSFDTVTKYSSEVNTKNIDYYRIMFPEMMNKIDNYFYQDIFLTWDTTLALSSLYIEEVVNENHITFVFFNVTKEIIHSFALVQLFEDFIKLCAVSKNVHENETGATFIINKVIEYAKEKSNIKYIELECRQRLLNFYRKFNFEIFKEFHIYQVPHDSSSYIMRLYFKEKKESSKTINTSSNTSNKSINKKINKKRSNKTKNSKKTKKSKK